MELRSTPACRRVHGSQAPQGAREIFRFASEGQVAEACLHAACYSGARTRCEPSPPQGDPAAEH